MTEADRDGDGGESESDARSDAAGSTDPSNAAAGSGPSTVRVVVRDGDERATLDVERGRTLREALLDAGLSPYAAATRRLNCGGRGLCATCGVRVRAGPSAEHWHDRLAERFGYPRLSCQISVDEPMTVELVEKTMWGQLRPHRSSSAHEQS
jgi:ferredoxin